MIPGNRNGRDWTSSKLSQDGLCRGNWQEEFKVWFLALSEALAVPVVMMIFGGIFRVAAPKKINSYYGYRTTLSMKNRDTWEFAHHYLGNLWFKISLLSLPLSILSLTFVIGKSSDAKIMAGLVVCIVDAVIMIVSLFSVEAALKRTFDKDGNRKDELIT